MPLNPTNQPSVFNWAGCQKETLQKHHENGKYKSTLKAIL